MGNQIYFQIAGYVDLDVLIISIPCQIFDIINGSWDELLPSFGVRRPSYVVNQWKPNMVWIITRVSSFKIVSDDAVHQPTWPLLLKIEKSPEL
jgi:hypothetical protein